MKIKLFLFILFGLFVSKAQYLSTEGKDIIDKDNNPILLKGIGLGGWMLQEPYMMESSGGASNQQEYKRKLTELIGESRTQTFFDTWLDNFVTKEDIDSIASWGFNSVRLPMHYNLFTLPIEEEENITDITWLNKGFEMVDELLAWCEENELYLILDLHAAPGGQGYDEGISDYDPEKPSLWESIHNKNKTVALWGKLAERYQNEQWIGGYDLINETNWSLSETDLRSLYIRITNEIRTHDQNHVIFIEGNWFANDFTGLTPPWDDNMVYSFHKYWNNNTIETIQWVIDMRNQYNVPLWMGESGENSNVWYKEAISLFEQNNIGWAWWPWKRLNTIVSTLSINSNENYDAVMRYWKGEAGMPNPDDAYQGMMDLAENALIQNNNYHKDVVDAMLRQPSSDELLPYSEHTIPGFIHATHYDMGSQGRAYYDNEYGNYGGSGGTSTWNRGWKFRNDGVDISASNSQNIESNGYSIGYVNDREWINYSVKIEQEGYYDVQIMYASENNGGAIRLELNNTSITNNISLSSTGSFESFQSTTSSTSFLEEGTHSLKLRIVGNDEFNIESLNFILADNQAPNFSTIGGIIKDSDTTVEVVFNKSLASQSIDASFFEIKADQLSINVVAAEIDSDNARVIELELESYISFDESITVSYSGNSITSIDDDVLPVFVDFPVENLLEEIDLIPGKIEAESFETQNGLATEETTDIGLGLNLKDMHPGDYATYSVDIKQNTYYNIQARIATEKNGAQFSIEFRDENNVVFLETFTVPNTNGWQNWQTIEKEALLPAGKYTLKFNVLGNEFNLNWLNFEIVDNSNLATIPGLIEAESYDTQVGIISSVSSDIGGGYQLGYLDNGDYADYGVYVSQTGTYTIKSRVASAYNDAEFQFTLESADGLSYNVALIDVPNTGGWNNWQTIETQGVLKKGNYVLKMTSLNSATNLNWYEFEFVSSDINAAEIPGLIQAEDFTSKYGVEVENTSDNGGGSNLSYIGAGDFTNYDVRVNQTGFYTIQARLAGYDPSEFNLVFSQPNVPANILHQFTTPETNGWQNWETVEAVVLLQTGDYTMTMNVLEGSFNLNWFNFIYDENGGIELPGVIEAEDYWSESGVMIENCSDTGGGSNLSHLHLGDYTNYFVHINQSGSYKVKARVSSAYTNGRFNLVLDNVTDTPTALNNFQVPQTGGWQNWETIEQEFDLISGSYTLNMNVVGNEFNLNWIEFEWNGALSNPTIDPEQIILYPQPALNILYVVSPKAPTSYEILNIKGQIIQKNKAITSQKVEVSQLSSGIYFLKLKFGQHFSIHKFVKD